MPELMGMCNGIINDMKERFDSKLWLYEMRCDEIGRNVRLIKYGFDNKKSNRNKMELYKKNEIEQCDEIEAEIVGGCKM